VAIHAALVHIFSIIPSQRVAEEIVEKVVRLSFDAQTGALSVVETPFITRSEIARLSFQNG
jgi:hypothetical protein